jgi:pimeloyl-ACP methyl ester carboxylesterase
MSAIILEQEVVHYEVLGRGRPLIFLHGWVGSWRYWIPVMQAASLTFRAYALDQWGFGDTAKDPNRYSLDWQLALLDGFLDQMGIARVALVGHGLGAMLAMLYARAHPELVDRVMVISLPFDESMITPRLRSYLPGDAAEWLLGKSTALEAVRLEASRADARAVQAGISDLNGIGLAELVRNPAVNTLLVHGEKDLAVELPRPAQLADLTDRAHMVTFENSGHFPMLDDGSKFNRLLGDFTALISGESPRQLTLKEEWKRRVR